MASGGSGGPLVALDGALGCMTSNQDQILLVKIREYIDFYVDRRSGLLWSPVIGHA